MRLSGFVLSLRNNSSTAIASLNRLRVEVVEEFIERGRKNADRLDSLQRSLQFFQREYAGDEKTKYIAEIEAEISRLQTQIEQNPVPQTVRALRDTYPAEAKKSMMLLINDLRGFFLVDNMLSTPDVESLSQMIIEDYGDLTFEELGICFNRAKKGHYGELYNRLDGQIIMGWLQRFESEKIERICERNRAQHVNNKEYVDYHRPKTGEKDSLNIAYAKVAIEKAKNELNQKISK